MSSCKQGHWIPYGIWMRRVREVGAGSTSRKLAMSSCEQGHWLSTQLGFTAASMLLLGGGRRRGCGAQHYTATQLAVPCRDVLYDTALHGAAAPLTLGAPTMLMAKPKSSFWGWVVEGWGIAVGRMRTPKQALRVRKQVGGDTTRAPAYRYGRGRTCTCNQSVWPVRHVSLRVCDM